jgi:hypothetical protein
MGFYSRENGPNINSYLVRLFELKKSPQRQPSDFSPRSSFDGAFDQFQSSPLTRVIWRRQLDFFLSRPSAVLVSDSFSDSPTRGFQGAVPTVETIHSPRNTPQQKSSLETIPSNTRVFA